MTCRVDCRFLRFGFVPSRWRAAAMALRPSPWGEDISSGSVCRPTARSPASSCASMAACSRLSTSRRTAAIWYSGRHFSASRQSAMSFSFQTARTRWSRSSGGMSRVIFASARKTASRSSATAIRMPHSMLTNCSHWALTTACHAATIAASLLSSFNAFSSLANALTRRAGQRDAVLQAVR